MSRGIEGGKYIVNKVALEIIDKAAGKFCRKIPI